jgi:hypothetical protein
MERPANIPRVCEMASHEARRAAVRHRSLRDRRRLGDVDGARVSCGTEAVSKHRRRGSRHGTDRSPALVHGRTPGDTVDQLSGPVAMAGMRPVNAGSPQRPRV